MLWKPFIFCELKINIKNLYKKLDDFKIELYNIFNQILKEEFFYE